MIVLVTPDAEEEHQHLLFVCTREQTSHLDNLSAKKPVDFRHVRGRTGPNGTNDGSAVYMK